MYQILYRWIQLPSLKVRAGWGFINVQVRTQIYWQGSLMINLFFNFIYTDEIQQKGG